MPFYSPSDVARFFTREQVGLEYPAKPKEPKRENFATHAAYGAAIDAYEANDMRVWREKQSEYRKRANEIEAAFKAALLEALGIADHPKANRLFDLAWEHGHSGGYGDVANYAEDFAELLKP